MGLLYMTIATISWSGIAFLYRLSENRRANRFYMSAMMSLSVLGLYAVRLLVSDINIAHTGNGQYILGIVLGAVSIIGFPVFLAAVSCGDLSITWMIMSLSFGPAAVLSVIYPGDTMSMTGIIGLALTGVAVVMLGIDMRKRNRSAPAPHTAHTQSTPKTDFSRNEMPDKTHMGGKRWGILTAISFFTNMLSLYCFALSSHMAVVATPAGDTPDPAHGLAFLMSWGLVSGVGLFIVARVRPLPGTGIKSGLLIGMAGGVVLFCGQTFQLLALNGARVPAYVLFPVTTGGSNLLVVVMSVLVLKERPGAYGWGGIAIGTAAIGLLSLAVVA